MSLAKSISSDETLTDSKNEEEEENVWASILDQVKTSSSKKLVSGKNVVILGDGETGKTTLVAKLQGNEDPKKGQGLEYQTIDVVDEDRDEHSKMGVYVLDGDPVHSHLLKFVLEGSSLQDVLVVLTASMCQPWTIMEHLDSWSTILEDFIDRLNMSGNDLQECRQRQTRFFQEYVEPGENSTSMTRSQMGLQTPDQEDQVLLPLDEFVLTKNLGVPIVVVITKTDSMSNLEKEYDYQEEHFDFIQQAIRKFCLTYGAGLCYCSVKEEKNCDLLYKYLVHRLYGLPFNTGALVVDKDAVFVPCGWDSEKKIAILRENMSNIQPDDQYSQVISRPPALLRSKAQQGSRQVEVAAEDDQAFLGKVQAQLTQQLPAAAQAAMMGGPKSSPETRRVAANLGPAGSPGSPKKGASPLKPNATQGSGEVLANFFQSLISKDKGRGQGDTSPRGTPPSPAMTNRTAADRDAVRKEAADVLDRLSGKRPVQGATTNSTDT